jgi:hypothetical protein
VGCGDEEVGVAWGVVMRKWVGCGNEEEGGGVAMRKWVGCGNEEEGGVWQ